jgi:Skp family chaperone for outer membrane proteins
LEVLELSREVNLEKLRVELEAKLSVLQEFDTFLHRRMEELEKALGDMENRSSKVQATPEHVKRAPTKRQVDYALDLARQTGFKVSEQELQNMSFQEVSRLIDQLLEKRKGGKQNG